MEPWTDGRKRNQMARWQTSFQPYIHISIQGKLFQPKLVNLNGDYGLWLTMMWRPGTTQLWAVWDDGEAVIKRKGHAGTLHLPFSFPVNLKLL